MPHYDVTVDEILLLVRRLSSTTPPVLALGWFDPVRAAVAKCATQRDFGPASKENFSRSFHVYAATPTGTMQ